MHVLLIIIPLLLVLANAAPGDHGHGLHLQRRESRAEDFPLRPGYVRHEDMILPIGFYNKTRNAIVSAQNKWPGARVPYVIDDSLAHLENEINRAMEEYHAKTCVRFVPRSSEADFIVPFYGEGCYSYVGRQGGQQEVSIGQGCSDHGTIVHELGHAIGFHHEHQRSDRDQHITIYWQNIQSGMEAQFEKLQPYENTLINAYDPSSIMHYGSTAFSKDGYSPAMKHKGGQPLYEPYQKSGLTNSDVKRINKLYNC